MRIAGIEFFNHTRRACLLFLWLTATPVVFAQLGPTIVSPPLSQTVSPGANVSFHVTAIAASPYYIWRRNTIAFSSGPANTITLTNVQLSNAGDYTVEVTDDAFPVVRDICDPFRLVVLQAPQISSQPKGQTNIANASVTFTVVAKGGPPPAYQWNFNDIPITGATEQPLSRQYPINKRRNIYRGGQ